MIARFIDVLSEAGFELTHEQIADAIWLSIHLPKEASRLVEVEPAPPAGENNQFPPRSSQAAQTDAPPSPKPRSRTIRQISGPSPGELFIPKPGISGTSTMRATAVRVPAAEALPNKPGLNAALRPLKRRVPSSRLKVLDVSATVEQIANGGPVFAVLKPAPERWMEALLIVDESASMRVWRETIQEFATLLERHGSFRDVRSWYVNLDDGTLRLYSESGLPSSPRRLRHPRELIDPRARRLILVMSDCVAPGWQNGTMFRVIREWGQRGPLSLLQVLPERLWSVTALGDSTTQLRAYFAGAPNAFLESQTLQFEYPSDSLAPKGMPLPVVNLEGWSVAPWAKLVANVGEATAEGVTITPQNHITGRQPEEEGKAAGPVPVVSAAERVARFRSAASPSARELASYLSAAPLCLPVMRLVQKAMMPVVRQVDLAEVLLSGLMQQATPAEQVGRAEDVFYEFIPGVRELLRDSVRQADQLRVLREVSRLIESQSGTTIDFAALLAGDASVIGSQNLYPIGQKFAELAPQVVRRLGWLANVIAERVPQGQEAREGAVSGVQAPSVAEPEPPIATPKLEPLRVYVSYSSGDDRLVRKFVTRLRQLDREGWTSTWSAIDFDLSSASDFQDRVSKNLEKSNVFVALLSPNYFKSEWGRGESTRAIRLGATIVPVFLEPVSMKDHPVFPYLVNPARSPISTTGNEDRAIEETVAWLRERFIDKITSIARDKARNAVVTVTSGDSIGSGFFVSPWGHILTSPAAIASRSPVITLPDGSTHTAVTVASDREADLALLQIQPGPSILTIGSDWPLAFGPLANVSQEVMGTYYVGSNVAQSWVGRIVGQDSRGFLRVQTNTQLPFGIAGAPLLDTLGRVAGVFQRFESGPDHYVCTAGPHVEQFVSQKLSGIVPQRFELEAVGVRVLRHGGDIHRYIVVRAQNGTGEQRTEGYANGQISIGRLSCRAERKFTTPDIVTSASVLVEGIVVGQRFTVDRISMLARADASPDGAKKLIVDMVMVENMRLDGVPVDIKIDPQARQANSLVASISTTHTAASITDNTLFVTGLGRIEILSLSNSHGNSSVCGMRIHLDDPEQTVAELATINLGDLSAAKQPFTAPEETRMSVLVVGTGQYELPRAVQHAAQQVGISVAKTGGTLITGGWPGVDHVAAEAFFGASGLKVPPAPTQLLQVVEEGQRSDFDGGTIVTVPHGQSTIESLGRADVVILIGGAGGTWLIFVRALAANKLVIPFRNTGTDALHAAILLEVLGQNVPLPLLRSQFSNESQARASGRMLERILEVLDAKAASRHIDNRQLRWMTETVLPLAQSYLRKAADFDPDANQVLTEFKSTDISSSKHQELALALMGDFDPAWRCTGYLAIQARPSGAFVTPLADGLDTEMKLAGERKETRPLWRWISAVDYMLNEYRNAFPRNLASRIETAARTISARSDVDPGGECEKLMYRVLRKLMPMESTPA